MSNEVMVTEYNPLAEIENTNQIMSALMKLPHYQKMGPDVVFAITAKAKSLRMDPIYALNGGLFNIKGKIGMPAESMASMIREKGHSIQKDKLSNDTICILHGKRADNGDMWTCKFSVDDAKKAGIYSGTWEKYTAAMCYNRAMSFLARQLFPDVIKGAGYTMDELKEIAGDKHEDRHDEKFTGVTITMPNGEIEFKPEVKIKMISEEQALEFQSEFNLCSSEYKKSIIHGFTNRGYSPSSFPIDMFDKALAGAKLKAAEYQAELKAKAEEMQKAKDGE